MEYDYIIVGAGSSGCVVAERLSRDGKSRVLLLEDGSANQSPLITMPRGWAKYWNNPRYYWIFPVEPERGRPPGETWAYGRGLGGSSALNGTMYFRGEPQDYDSWEAMGNHGWNWRQIERCYRELENFNVPEADASRGRQGPMEITVVPEKSEISEAVISAGIEMGLPRLIDINTPGVSGIGYTQATVDKHRRRVSGYTAFLRPALTRKNLKIVTGARVNHVLFDNKRASGVSYLRHGVERTATARCEVILCAGVLQSPKLLQLSGIGPRDNLSALGLPVVADLPAVGQNMIEHVLLSMSFKLRRIPGMNREFRGWRLYKNVLQYFIKGTGAMSYTTPEVSALFSSEGESSWPNMQLIMSPYSFERSSKPLTEPGRGRTDTFPGFTITAFLLRPRSRGSVSIRSANVDDLPMVRANWLADEHDQRDVVELVKLVRRFVGQGSLRNFIGEEMAPGAQIQTDEQILDSARTLLTCGLHGTGTCRMGPAANSVVDARLRVHGVSNLRVVDCSIMPTSISGNTNGPAMAIGLRAAELILEDRNCSFSSP